VREAKLTTVLDVVGVVLVAAFAFLVWAPLALLVAGLACLFASWSWDRSR
jgi:hypothetical protein